MAAVVAIAVTPRGDTTIVHADGRVESPDSETATARIIELEDAGTRWLWWNVDTARRLVGAGVRPARCWDVGAVHRLIVGGWRSTPAEVWAWANDLDPSTIPTVQPVDLFTQAVDTGDADQPIGPDGHLRPEWVDGQWVANPERAVRWTSLLHRLHDTQAAALYARADPPTTGTTQHLLTTAFAESVAEVVCAELEHDGLPFDRSVGESIVAGFVGRRPTSHPDEAALLAELDAPVLAHLPDGTRMDLRSPDQVKSLLRRVGIEVPDTRAWRLEALRDAHPVVDALLTWRRAERMRTTFGYNWIDDNVGTGKRCGQDRLRGRWSSADGSAGRMTATAGLHNMPAEMRPAIVADDGHVFVRADLGQIEPRVLAAVSGDPLLAAATNDDDMYAPVAERLRVERDIAKVAVLGAMYGQTTGKGAEALRGLEREYPVAMGHLRHADETAQGGRDLITYGGRRIMMSGATTEAMSGDDIRSRAAARGRYGRNAVVQGAAAEFFKTWTVLVRARTRPLGASIVLCLHDELVVHTPVAVAEETADLLDAALREAAERWSPPGAPAVRFVADTSIVGRWSDAK